LKQSIPQKIADRLIQEVIIYDRFYIVMAPSDSSPFNIILPRHLRFLSPDEPDQWIAPVRLIPDREHIINKICLAEKLRL